MKTAAAIAPSNGWRAIASSMAAWAPAEDERSAAT
jgi:hypothetical protein